MNELREFLKLALAIVCLMSSNILLGITLAKLKEQFEKGKVLAGIVKAVSILIGIVFIILAGYLTTDIIVANINGEPVNILYGVKLILIATIVWYGANDLQKLIQLFGLKTKIQMKEDEEIAVKKGDKR